MVNQQHAPGYMVGGRKDIMIDRLRDLQDDNDKAGREMASEKIRFINLADPSMKPRSVSAFNLFQTPEPIADRMASLLLSGIASDAVVLEPSAGLGRLYSALRTVRSGPIILAEQSPECCRELYGLTREDRAVTLKQGDFLAMDMQVDAVIMNPPFKMGRDIKHILHAFDMLQPGGLLISLCYNGVKQSKQLKPIADTWEILPAGSFKEVGTRAEVVILTMRK